MYSYIYVHMKEALPTRKEFRVATHTKGVQRYYPYKGNSEVLPTRRAFIGPTHAPLPNHEDPSSILAFFTGIQRYYPQQGYSEVLPTQGIQRCIRCRAKWEHIQSRPGSGLGVQAKALQAF